MAANEQTAAMRHFTWSQLIRLSTVIRLKTDPRFLGVFPFKKSGLCQFDAGYDARQASTTVSLYSSILFFTTVNITMNKDDSRSTTTSTCSRVSGLFFHNVNTHGETETCKVSFPASQKPKACGGIYFFIYSYFWASFAAWGLQSLVQNVRKYFC